MWYGSLPGIYREIRPDRAAARVPGRRPVKPSSFSNVAPAERMMFSVDEGIVAELHWHFGVLNPTAVAIRKSQAISRQETSKGTHNETAYCCSKTIQTCRCAHCTV